MNDRVKTIALLAGGALALATAAIIFALRAAGKGATAGFLGPGSLLADLNLVLEALLVLGVTAGMLLARRGRIEAHRVNQTIWALVNVALVVAVMIPSLQNAKIGSLADLAHASAAVPWLHAALGLLTGFLCLPALALILGLYRCKMGMQVGSMLVQG